MDNSSTTSRAALWIIIASSSLTVMAGAILGPVVNQIQAGLDVSESFAGLILTTHAAFIVLTSPISGWLIDRFGPRRPYIAGLMLYAIGGGAGLVVDSFIPLLLTRAVLGIGVALVYTGVTVLIYDLYEGQQMDRALGLRSGANSFGGAVWPLIGGALGAITWQWPFAIYLVAFPLGLLTVVAVPSTGRSSDGTREDETTQTGGISGVVSVLARQPALACVYLLYFGANALVYAVIVFYPQLLADVGVVSTSQVGLFLAAQGAAGALSGGLYDRFVKRVRSQHLVFLAFALWVAAFVLATRIDSVIGAIPPVILFGLGLGLVFPSTFRWIESLAPQNRQGQFSSYLATVGYAGQFVSPIVFGQVLALSSVRGVFGAAAATVGLGLISLGSVLWHRQ